jgi:hypothetical protein
VAEADWVPDQPKLFGTWSHVRIAAGHAHLISGSVDGAAEQISPVLELASEYRLATLTEHMVTIHHRLLDRRFRGRAKRHGCVKESKRSTAVPYVGSNEPFSTEMGDHWWQRPGRRADRELYHWHMLFHDQPGVRDLAAKAQDHLAGLPGLDLVPNQWLHQTTYIVGFVDEVPDTQIEAMVAEPRRLLAGIRPILVNLGRVFYHPEAVTPPVEPGGVLDPVLDGVRAASEFAGCGGYTGTNPSAPTYFSRL